MRGSTKKIQYGMPASCSAPMEPYLKRMSGVAVTQSGCGFFAEKFIPADGAADGAEQDEQAARQIFHQDFFFCASAIVTSVQSPQGQPRSVQKVLRYSTSASFSAAGSSVP